MLILGIDPGTATTGYGFLTVNSDNSYEVGDFGLIETAKEGNPGFRLTEIHTKLSNLIALHKPDVMVMEKLFFFNNAKTVIRVGQAQGIMLLAAAQMNIETVEIAPARIKKVITGSGRAKKIDVQRSLRELLGPKIRSKKHKKTHFDNAADALAIALCHALYKEIK